jgi:acyl carrier protein
MRDRILEVMARVLGVPAREIDASASTDGLGTWDSMQHINLVLALEETFDVRFSTEETGSMTSYVEIKRMLERHGIVAC